MTAVFAWTDNRAAYLVADTALTSADKGTVLTFRGEEIRSSTGMGHRGRPAAGQAKFVIEREQKVLRLRHDVLISYTGDVPNFHGWCRLFARDLQGGGTIEAALHSATAAWQSTRSDGFCAIIATHRSGSPELITYIWPEGVQASEQMVVAGSAQGVPAARSVADVMRVASNTPSPRDALLAVLTAANWSALRVKDQLVWNYVGGTLIGGFVGEAGAEWQPATQYLPLPRRIARKPDRPFHSISVAIVEDVAVIGSTLSSKKGRVLKILGAAVRPDPDGWNARHASNLRSSPLRFDFAIVLPASLRQTAVILPKSTEERAWLKFVGDKLHLRSDFVGAFTQQHEGNALHLLGSTPQGAGWFG